MTEPPVDPPPEWRICPECGKAVDADRRHVCRTEPDDGDSFNFELDN